MKRFGAATALVGLLFNGCAAVVDPVAATPAPIPPTQFLRPTLDGETNTWVAGWVDPNNFVSLGGDDTSTN